VGTYQVTYLPGAAAPSLDIPYLSRSIIHLSLPDSCTLQPLELVDYRPTSLCDMGL